MSSRSNTVIVDEQLESYLMRSLVLKPTEKSPRRFRIRQRPLGRYQIGYPQIMDSSMLVIPEVSIAGITKSNKLVFLNRFSMIEPTDDLPTPVISKYTCLEVQTQDEGEKKILRATKTSRVPEWGDLRYCQKLKCRIWDDISSILPQGFQINYNSGLLYTLKSKDSAGFLVRIDKTLFSTKSLEPSEILRSVLYQSIHILPKLPSYKCTPLPEIIAQFVAGFLRYFCLQSDFATKMAYHTTLIQSNQVRREAAIQLFKNRIWLLKALLWLKNELFDSLLQTVHSDDRYKNWLFTVEERLAQATSNLEQCQTHSLTCKEIFDWQPMSWEESSVSWWLGFVRQAATSAIAEFEDKITKLIPRNPLSPEDMEALQTSKDLLGFMHALPDLIDKWNSGMTTSASLQPDFVGIQSACTQPEQTTVVEAVEKQQELLPLQPTIASYSDSFLLPSKARKNPKVLELAIPPFLLKVTTGVGCWNFELLTSEDPAYHGLGSKFSVAKPGVWSARTSFDWSLLSDVQLDPPPAWELLDAEFSVEMTFLLCTDQNYLTLVVFDTLNKEKVDFFRWLDLLSPFEDTNDSLLVERTRFYYQDLHERHRSQILKWVECEDCLLWAVMVVSNPKQKDGFVECSLCLSAFRFQDSELLLQTEFVSKPEREWLCVVPGIGTKTRFDPRLNPNLCLYFIWRVVADRCLGIWLRARGGYQIYLKKQSRFVLCAQKSSVSFADHFMTELVPATPGLCGIVPILLKRNHTIRVTVESCSFDLVELRVHIV